MEFSSPSLVWFIAGVVLFLMEMAVPGFVVFFFGVGAWITALAAFLFPIGLNAQILLFTISSVLSLLLLRTFVRSAFSGDVAETEEETMVARGTLVEVVSDILPPAEGKVKFSGTTWRATSATPLRAGELAEVVTQRGLVFTVTEVTSQK